ncbi:MAG: hypothetical protein H6675_01850 [Dehalococcoidia bacterium]|nr:hypothetical protein [Dehalococcoidia bacterium]
MNVTGKEVTESEGLAITDALIVVGGGRGLGAAEAFEDMKALAAAIGKDKAAVGASRARGRPRLVPAERADRSDRQGRDPGPVHRHRDLGRQPAHGRLLGLEDDRGRQP